MEAILVNSSHLPSYSVKRMARIKTKDLNFKEIRSINKGREIDSSSTNSNSQGATKVVCLKLSTSRECKTWRATRFGRSSIMSKSLLKQRGLSPSRSSNSLRRLSHNSKSKAQSKLTIKTAISNSHKLQKRSAANTPGFNFWEKPPLGNRKAKVPKEVSILNLLLPHIIKWLWEFSSLTRDWEWAKAYF